jgi:hypothetical protein
MKSKCLKCNRTYKMITPENLCAECHLNKYGKWAETFSKPKDK